MNNMDKERLVSELSKITFKIVCIKMYIQELIDYFSSIDVECNGYELEIYDGIIYISSLFTHDIGEENVEKIKNKMSKLFKKFDFNCGIKGWSIEIYRF